MNDVEDVETEILMLPSDEQARFALIKIVKALEKIHFDLTRIIDLLKQSDG